MKVLIINGSPRINGNTTIAINELEKVFKENNIECNTFQIGNKAIRGCIACEYCYKNKNAYLMMKLMKLLNILKKLME